MCKERIDFKKMASLIQFQRLFNHNVNLCLKYGKTLFLCPTKTLGVNRAVTGNIYSQISHLSFPLDFDSVVKMKDSEISVL